MAISNAYKQVILAETGLLRYYRMDTASGTVLTDSSGNGKNGTISGTVTYGTTGLIRGDTNTAMTFSVAGTSSISIPTTGLPTGANHWSVECWVKMPSLPSGGTTYFMCLCLGTVTTGGKTIAIYYFAGTTKSFVLDNDNGFDIASTAAPVAGTTYHLVGTYDGSKMQFYVNGTAQNTGTAATMNLTYGSAYIGNDGSGDYFGGIIDEVAIYNVTLTATQVTNHYNAGLAITKVAPIRSKLRTQRTPSTSVRTFLRNSRTDTNPARSVIRTAQTRTNSLRSPL